MLEFFCFEHLLTMRPLSGNSKHLNRLRYSLYAYFTGVETTGLAHPSRVLDLHVLAWRIVSSPPPPTPPLSSHDLLTVTVVFYSPVYTASPRSWHSILPTQLVRSRQLVLGV